MLAVLVPLGACNPDSTSVSPNSKDLGNLSSALLVDTFTVRASTHWYDSTLGSETNIVMVGNYSHPLSGSITGTGYFDFVPPLDTARVPASSRYDSITIKLPYTWQHTDTLPKFTTVELHRLTGPISKDSIFLARSARGYSPEVLATDTLIATTRSTRSGKILFFKLTDARTPLGAQIWAEAKAGFKRDSRYIETFSKRFYGFALVAAGTKTVIANVEIANGAMVAYGTLKGKSGADSIKYDFGLGIGSTNRFYGSVATDWAGTPLAGLSSTTKSLPTAQTGGNAYIQNYSALWTKVDFPSFFSFKKRNPNLTLLRAVLVLNAKNSSLAYQGPMARIIPWLGHADRINMARNGTYSLALSNGQPAAGNTVDAFVQRYDTLSKSYTIDLTQYLLAVEQGFIYNSGLWLTAPAGIPFLAPFIFRLSPADADRSRLKAYFVRLK